VKTDGVNQSNINAQKIGAFGVRLPKLPEQKEIVRRLDNFLNKEKSICESCEASLAAIEAMKKAILAKAFRGELGTNNPAEESSKELLMEIISI
jgi:type I restriction enzyme S subunit